MHRPALLELFTLLVGLLPEAHGGLGPRTLDRGLLAEERAYGGAAVATSILCHYLGALPLLITRLKPSNRKRLRLNRGNP